MNNKQVQLYMSQNERDLLRTYLKKTGLKKDFFFDKLINNLIINNLEGESKQRAIDNPQRVCVHLSEATHQAIKNYCKNGIKMSPTIIKAMLIHIKSMTDERLTVTSDICSNIQNKIEQQISLLSQGIEMTSTEYHHLITLTKGVEKSLEQMIELISQAENKEHSNIF